MRFNQKLATLIACLLLLSFVVVQASDRHAKLGERRTVALPRAMILDEFAQPIIAASGKVGFVSSVTTGAVVCFNVASGRVMSSLVVGESVGPLTLVEAAGRRLLAAPSANDPTNGHPATVSIVDATRAKQLELQSLLVLPAKAALTQATRALMTADGKLCLIASSGDEPALLAFDVETGQVLAQAKLEGQPAEVALFDDGKTRRMAVTSVAANTLSIFSVGAQGALTEAGTFSPAGGRFNEANNPAFSGDGRMIYIAAAEGEQVFALDSDSGILLDAIAVSAPHSLTVARAADGVELLAVTNMRAASSDKRGGVTILKSQHARLFTQAEFAPPEGIAFSRANNVAFTADGGVAFVTTATGVLFAFNTETGELESYQAIGGELRRLALSEKTQTVAAIRSSQGGDEIVVINFDLIKPDTLDPNAPLIESLQPAEVEQGRLKNLQLVVTGQRLGDGASILVNGVEMAAEVAPHGRALEARLPRALFDEVKSVSIQVKGANGALSAPRDLHVVRPGAPILDDVRPAQVAGPSAPFVIKVTGRNFRASSTIFVAGRALDTQQVSATTLQALVPADLLQSPGQLKVLVRDLAVSDLVSANNKDLLVYGPRITELAPAASKVVAGDGEFSLRIRGENFRSGATVEVNGEALPATVVHQAGRTLINVRVPRQFTQDAGKLAVTVRNPEGAASDAAAIDVHAPQIVRFAQKQVMAGTSRARIDIRGTDFRRGARVYVGNGRDLNLQLSRTQVRFRSSTHLTITLKDELKKLLEQPGQLQFNVVNPNSGDGVTSQKAALNVVGPVVAGVQFEAVAENSRQVRLLIAGANFRRGALVEFVKGDAVVRQATPESLQADHASVVVSARVLEALGDYSLRVVNPGPVASTPFRPNGQAAVAGNDDE
ncbi:MAG TPA: PQQ-binding-like beta-propeller repeat protein [Blastocatellia bacterium]|nr:PQQ-binding-like beta-propeller repeat protein [Blastocatellia bacterium]